MAAPRAGVPAAPAVRAENRSKRAVAAKSDKSPDARHGPQRLREPQRGPAAQRCHALGLATLQSLRLRQDTIVRASARFGLAAEA
jgi:hypothetical protein